MSSICKPCNLNILQVEKYAEDWSNCLHFLLDHDLIKKEKSCEKCNGTAKIVTHSGKPFWSCRRTYQPHGDEDFQTIKCNYRKSLYNDTWFSNTKLSIKVNIILVQLYLEPNFNALQASEILSINKNTMTDYTNFLREVFVDYCILNKQQIGGEGRVVEIDEAKFGKRKYNRGRVIEGQWVFGGIDTTSKKSFYVAVEDRSQETLLKVIKMWIKPGTTIVSDCWKAYNCLQNEGFLHLTVNHTYNFVDPNTGANTNTIERQWRDLRAWMQRMGPKVDYDGHLARIMFIKQFPVKHELIHQCWKHIGKMTTEGKFTLREK